MTQSFEPGDIVVIIKYPWVSEAVGRSAEVQSVHPRHPHHRELQSLLDAFAPHDTIWYILIDSTGQKRCAAHTWLRKLPSLWTPSMAREETTA